ERRSLARALEAHRARARPRDHGALRVGDADDGVVEGGMNVDHALGDHTLGALAARGGGPLAGRCRLLAGRLSRSCHTRSSAVLALRRRRLLPLDGTPRPFPRARVGVRPLPANRQVSAMAAAAVAAEIDQPLDARRHVAPEVALDLVARIEDPPDARALLVGQIIRLAPRIHLRLGADPERRAPADAVDVRERYFHALVSGQIDAGDTCHVLSLSLLVPRVRALDAHHARAADDLAVLADDLDRCPDLHVSSL